MKRRVILLSLIIIILGLLTKSLKVSAFEVLLPPIEPVDDPISKPSPDCQIGGCSGQLCIDASKEPIFTTCEWREEYACYKTATCELQANDNCGWTMTDELLACLGGGNVKPTLTPGPTCGNQICEPDEAIESTCPICTNPPNCPLMPCYINPNYCPSDCETFKPSLTPIPELTPHPQPEPHPDACTNSGGNWKTFTNGCADFCPPTGNLKQICLDVITNSCDCEPDKCWNGETCINTPNPQPTPTPKPTKPWFKFLPKPIEKYSQQPLLEKPNFLRRFTNFFHSLQTYFQNYWIEHS